MGHIQYYMFCVMERIYITTNGLHRKGTSRVLVVHMFCGVYNVTFHGVYLRRFRVFLNMTVRVAHLQVNALCDRDCFLRRIAHHVV